MSTNTAVYESVLTTLAENIGADRRITLDLNHVRAMDDVARRLLDDAAAGLRENGHDVAIHDPHGLMAAVEVD